MNSISTRRLGWSIMTLLRRSAASTSADTESTVLGKAATTENGSGKGTKSSSAAAPKAYDIISHVKSIFSPPARGGGTAALDGFRGALTTWMILFHSIAYVALRFPDDEVRSFYDTTHIVTMVINMPFYLHIVFWFIVGKGECSSIINAIIIRTIGG
jgi:hypothetical protein